MNNIEMLKLLKMLKQVISQLEQMCLKLGLKNGYTLTVSNFKRQFVPQKWPGTGKGVITEGLKISSQDLKKALVTGTWVMTRNGVWLQILLNVLWALIVERFIN